jgi:hypothetical protein
MALLGALLASGSIPLVGRLLEGRAIDGKASFGFVVVLGSLLLILRELWVAHRRHPNGHTGGSR